MQPNLDEIYKVSSEEERRELARAKGLPEDASWGKSLKR